MKIQKNSFFEILVISVLATLSAITINNIFRGDNIIYFWDNYIPFNAKLQTYLQSYAWLDQNLGISNPSTNLAFISYVYEVAESLFPLFLFQRILYFMLLFFQGIFVYLFLRVMFKYLIGLSPATFSMVGAIFLYMFNPFSMVYAWLYYLYIPLSLTFLPLALTAIIILGMSLSQDKINSQKLFLSTLVLHVSTFIIFSSGVKNAIPSLIFIAFFAFYAAYRKSLSKKRAALFVLSCISSLSSSVYIWLPTYLASQARSATYMFPKDIGLYVYLLEYRNQACTFFNSIRILGMVSLNVENLSLYLAPFYTTTPLILLTIVPFLISTFPLLARERGSKDYLFFYALMLSAATALSALHIPLLSSAYKWLYIQLFPLLTLFNDPWPAFGPVFTFLLAVCFAFGVDKISHRMADFILRFGHDERKFKRPLIKTLKITLLIFLLLTPLIISYPMISGDFVPDNSPIKTVFGIDNASARVRIPQYEVETANYLDSLPQDYRLLILPSSSSLSAIKYDGCSYLARNMLTFMTDKEVVGDYFGIIPKESNPLLHIAVGLYSNTSLLWGGYLHDFLNLDYSSGFIIPAQLFVPAETSGFLMDNYKFIVSSGGRFNVTFEAFKRVGHVDVLIHVFNENNKSWSTWDYLYVYSENPVQTFLIELPHNAKFLIEPRIWNDSYSDVNYVVIKHEDTQIEEPHILGYQYINTLKMLGIDLIVLREDIKGSKILARPEPDSNYILRLLAVNGINQTRSFGPIKILKVSIGTPKIYAAQQIILTNTTSYERLVQIVSSNINFEKLAVMSSEEVGNLSLKFTNETAPPKIEYKKISPAKYEIHVANATEPFLLVLRQNYDPAWEALIVKNDEKLAVPKKYHLITNWFANSWYINQTGSFLIVLEYTPQKLYDLTLTTSMLTFLTIIAATVVSYSYTKTTVAFKKLRQRSAKTKI